MILFSPGNRLAILLLFACAPAPIAHAEDEARDGKWIQLFNGKNLDGWTPKITGYELGDNFADTFRVEDGVLKVSYDGYESFDGKFGHIFYKAPFSSYRLRVEYRFVGEQVPGGPTWAFRNSGVMIHGQPPRTMAKDQKFPVSIEVQLLGGREEGQRPTANLCTPGTHVVMNGELLTRHCTSSESKTYRDDGWVTVEVVARGAGTIEHFVQGQKVMSYSQPQLDESDADARKLLEAGGEKFISGKLITGGSISLQSESHPIEFRKVELMKLEE